MYYDLKQKKINLRLHLLYSILFTIYLLYSILFTIYLLYSDLKKPTQLSFDKEKKKNKLV